MADVARVAGVSHQTVSRVINDADHVRPETRERVLRAMVELDYRPNPVARALVTGRSRTLGVVSFDTTLYGPASTLFGIERAAHTEGYFVSIVSVTSLDRASVLGAVERLRAQGVDGILIITPQELAAEAVLHVPPDLAVVAVEAGPEEQVPVVAVDQFAGAVAATEHLLALGHRTVWHVAGPSDWLEARQRIDGWAAALEAAGADAPPLLTGDWSARSGYELGRRLATVGDRRG
jgi:DNA-binding LacI/PurR family transcriptional regulator